MTLQRCSSSADELNAKGDSYFLLVLYPHEHRVRVITFSKKDAGLNEAKEMYSALEKSWTTTSDYDVVLVSGKSIKVTLPTFNGHVLN
tara:strand:- start:6 stop:269 length:264 start_codon:yes stop_codon:yes gene_type:complete